MRKRRNNKIDKDNGIKNEGKEGVRDRDGEKNTYNRKQKYLIHIEIEIEREIKREREEK
jgi:hypothetical protein